MWISVSTDPAPSPIIKTTMGLTYVTRTRVLLTVGILVVALGLGVSLVAFQQQRSQQSPASPFSQLSVTPAYIVVGTSTQVLFTAKVADRQLKKRSVVLLRLDSAGKPSDLLGRLRDDGTNGDLKAGDDIYSIRVSLTETAVRPVPLAVAAWFKPGTWREPEADDDDWDREFTALGKVTRDRPALRALVVALLRRLGRYTVSNPVVLPVWQRYVDAHLGLMLPSPPTWRVQEDAQGNGVLKFSAEPYLSERDVQLVVSRVSSNLDVPQWFESRYGAPFVSIPVQQIAGRDFFTWHEAGLNDGSWSYATRVGGWIYIFSFFNEPSATTTNLLRLVVFSN